jgi:hypothetical protein
MIDHTSIQFALRAKLVALSVATTGAIAMSATATGYARATGSFLADGFDLGMEITPSGFAANPADIITAISALAITVRAGRPVEGSAGGRTLTAGLPSARSWENIAFEPTAGVPWVEEEYIPGPVVQVTLGPNGDLEATPMYAPKVHVPASTGMTASRYADAVLRLFAPRTVIPLPNGDVLRVRSDTGPFPGQLLQSRPGFAMKPITIPLRLRTSNSI